MALDIPNPQTSPAPAEKNSEGKSAVILVVILLAAIITFAAVWFVLNTRDTSTETSTTTPPTTQTSTVPDVKSDSDLKKLEDEVKNTDIDGLSKDLDDNDADTKGF